MSKREVMMVVERLNFWYCDIENAKNDLENQCKEEGCTELENQERKQRLSNVEKALKELDEIKGPLNADKEEYMKFYERQKMERGQFYRNLSPRLEKHASGIDQILLGVLPSHALKKSNKCHHTRIFIRDRPSFRYHPYSEYQQGPVDNQQAPLDLTEHQQAPLQNIKTEPPFDIAE